MRIVKIFIYSAVCILPINQQAHAECFGSEEYRVCSESYIDSSGNVQVRSWDNQGNTYSVNSETQRSPDGSTTIRSYDSQGNSYSVRSWSDSQGVHSVDSQGNRCIITKSGKIIGCK
jgi:hypothetical protein